MQLKWNRVIWFTLVELIVVITIVWILSTIWFVSYSGYLTWARDSNRISQLTKLSDSLQVYSASKTLPLPDDSITISASWSSNIIWYQWFVGVDVLETIDYTNGWKDPKDDSYYTYYLTKDRSSIQLMSLMEEASSVAQLNTFKQSYWQFEERFPKVYGRKLWIITQSDTNLPVQNLVWVDNFDVVNEWDSFVAHISPEEDIEWDGSELRAVIPNGSCKRIKQTGGSKWNWYYTINPSGSWDVTVYCDMETNWWGWTMVSRSIDNSDFDWLPFGWFVSMGSPEDNSAPYSLWNQVRNIPFETVYLTVYDSGKNITWVTSLEVNDDDIFGGGNGTNSIAVEWCEGPEVAPWVTSCALFSYWGKFDSTESYWFSNNPSDTDDGLNRRRYGATFPFPWMIFVK